MHSKATLFFSSKNNMYVIKFHKIKSSDQILRVCGIFNREMTCLSIYIYKEQPLIFLVLDKNLSDLSSVTPAEFSQFTAVLLIKESILFWTTYDTFWPSF